MNNELNLRIKLKNCKFEIEKITLLFFTKRWYSPMSYLIYFIFNELKFKKTNQSLEKDIVHIINEEYYFANLTQENLDKNKSALTNIVKI